MKQNTQKLLLKKTPTFRRQIGSFKICTTRLQCSSCSTCHFPQSRIRSCIYVCNFSCYSIHLARHCFLQNNYIWNDVLTTTVKKSSMQTTQHSFNILWSCLFKKISSFIGTLKRLYSMQTKRFPALLQHYSRIAQKTQWSFPARVTPYPAHSHHTLQCFTTTDKRCPKL